MHEKQNTNSNDIKWTKSIKRRAGWFDINLGEIWRYRDLIKIFVYRDFVVYYKQTILGPLWFLVKPLLTTIVFTIIFSNIAKIPTDNIPPVLFYLSGTVVWSYFSDCLRETSNTFVDNASIFGKVYFPRLVMPLSIVISKILTFGIQFILFLGFLFYFSFKGAPIHTNIAVIFLPLGSV